MAENIADKYDATGKSSGLMAKVDKTKKADSFLGNHLAGWVGMWYNSDDTSGEEASSVAAIQMEPHESMLARIQTSRKKPAYAPEGGDLVGRFNGQLGFASTNTNDTSSAVADAIIGNSVVEPVVAPVAKESSKLGLMARRDVEWGGGFREEFASYRDASETYINNLSPEYSNDERVTIPRPTFNLDKEEANLSIETTNTGFKYKNNNDAIDAMLRLAKDKYEPLQVAALQATMEAESSHDLVEDTRYSYDQAIKKFGDSTRKPLIDALYNGRTYLPPADQKTLFDIAYAQPGNDRLNAPNEGWLYRGRGPIQITGKNNYRLVGEAMGIGDALVKNPDLLISDPKILAAATLAYLDINGFGENTTSRNALYNVIRHAGGADGEDAKKRWERTEEIMKSNTSPTESSRPRSRPEGITTVGKRAPTDSPLAPASSPRPKPRPNSVASNTQKVTSALAERTRRPNSNQGF